MGNLTQAQPTPQMAQGLSRADIGRAPISTSAVDDAGNSSMVPGQDSAPSIPKPSFMQAANSGPGGTPNALSKGLTTKGKLLTMLLNAGKGAAAGAGSMTFGQGFQSGSELPFITAMQKQDAKLKDAQIQSIPLQRQKAMLDMSKTQADIDKSAIVTPRNGGVYNTATGKYAPGTEPTQKTETPDQQALDALTQKVNSATGKNYTADEALAQIAQSKQDTKPDKASTPEQQYISAQLAKGASIDQAIAGYAKLTQKPDKPEKTKSELVVTPDGTVTELKPGMKVPPGTKPASQYGKPSADEQRRADLAGNLKENLDTLEEIVNRRPDLFGPYHGRMTALKTAIGTDDPDIGTLETIKHQIGMAQISAHGMRSAHGIDGASSSIMNSFHNSPDAVRASIAAARKSVSTFENDVEEAKGEQPAKNTKPSSNGSSALPPKGAKVRDYTQLAN